MIKTYVLIVLFIVLLIVGTNILMSNNNVDYTNTSETPLPKIKKLKIVEGWTFDTIDNYIYIKGSVENIGNCDISYYKIRVKYLDHNGEVIDTDWTNGSDIRIGEQQRFEIISKDDDRIKRCTLSIVEIW